MRDFKDENPAVDPTYKIRYVNVNIIFDYMVKNDSNASNVRRRKEDTLAKIETINGQLANATDLIQKDEILKNQKQYYADLEEIEKDEDHYKNLFLNQIDSVLEIIAKKSDIDFILNIGEGVVYSKKEYDITEELLREIIKQKQRSAPVTR